MNAAERYARLRLLEHAVRQALPEAAAEAEAYRRQVGALSFQTDYGKVTAVQGKRAAYIADDRAFLEWVREHRPDELVETIRPSFTAGFLASLEFAEDGTCADRDGVEVPFAAWKTGRGHLQARLDPEIKAAAVDLVVEQVQAWALPEVER